MTKKIAERSRRAPGDGKRNCRVAVRYTPDEFAQVEATAGREGLVTAAWLGNAGLALAGPASKRQAANGDQVRLREIFTFGLDLGKGDLVGVLATG